MTPLLAFNPMIWFKKKQSHLIPILAIVFISVMVMISSANFNNEFKWDGIVYSTLVNKYLFTHDLSLFSMNDLPLWTQHTPIQSYFNRIGYYWVARLLSVITHLSNGSLFLLLDFLPLTLAGIFFYLTCYHYLLLNRTASLFAAIWLLILPSAKISYEVLAHPEGLCLLFMSTAMYFSLGRKHLLAAILLLFGILTRESVVILGVFLICYPIAHSTKKPELKHLLHLMPYAAAIIIGLSLPVYIQKSTSLSGFSYFALALEMNRHFSWVFLLHNFSIIWVPYLIGFSYLERRIQFCHVIILILACLLLTAALDWWRVLYGNIYFIVLPVAALTIQRFFKDHALYIFMFISLVLMSFPAHVNFERLQNPELWPYYATLLLFFLQSQFTGHPSQIVFSKPKRWV